MFYWLDYACSKIFGGEMLPETKEYYDRKKNPNVQSLGDNTEIMDLDNLPKRTLMDGDGDFHEHVVCTELSQPPGTIKSYGDVIEVSYTLNGSIIKLLINKSNVSKVRYYVNSNKKDNYVEIKYICGGYDSFNNSLGIPLEELYNQFKDLY